MVYKEQYGMYKDLVEKGIMDVYTKDINDSNVDLNFKNIINILSDGIETDWVQNMKLIIHFEDNVEVTLTIMDYLFNLMFWCLITCTGRKIESKHLFYEEAITKSSIKNYIDKNFIKVNMKSMEMISLNQNIDRAISKFRDLVNFQMYLANTINLEDTIELMRKYPEFNDTIHFKTDGIPLEDVKDLGMKAMNIQMNYIKNSDHCLRDAFIAGEGVSAKQYKEVSVNIGSKPNGLGSVFPNPISGSFINGGLKTPEEVIIESSIGRIAQILKKQNVGDSGAFARNLGLNNLDSKLNDDPSYSCDTKNLELIDIKNSDILDMYNMRYYRFIENGPEYLLDSSKDKHLIGKQLYFRSPMTCASAARGHGICYKCYGDLAYVNRNINIGQIAAELLSAIYTQILLSAKHLLESAIIKLEWTPEFYNWFSVQYNLINIKDNVLLKGMKIIIDPDDIIENELDDEEEDDYLLSGSSSYITSFIIRKADGTEVDIHTTDSDVMYLHSDLLDYLDNTGVNDDGIYEIDMIKVKDLSLFIIDVKNNELSKTMKTIQNIIDNKASTKSFNRNTILQAFIDNNLIGGIKINAVHFEVLLMNQIRSADDILLLPDWSHKNERYQLLTLRKSLSENRSISIRLQGSSVAKNLSNTSNRFSKQPSMMDLYAMEEPQKFMENVELSDYTLIDDKDTSVKSPIYFMTSNSEASLTSEDEEEMNGEEE